MSRGYSPLSLLVNSTKSLLKRTIRGWDAPHDKYYDRINESIDYITGLLNDVELVNSATTQGTVKTAKEELSLQDIAEQIKARVDTTYDQKEVLLVVYDTTQTQVITVDMLLLLQIVVSLLSNAVKYGASDQPAVLTITAD